MERDQEDWIVLWPDIAGTRAAFHAIARRFAGQNHSVLAVNSYYRDARGSRFEDFAAFVDEGGFATTQPWRAKLTSAAIESDARAISSRIDESGEVDRDLPLLTLGCCLGGGPCVVDRESAWQTCGGGIVPPRGFVDNR